MKQCPVKVEMVFHTLLSTGIRIVNKDCRRGKKKSKERNVKMLKAMDCW
jgi:hypothetical protein